MLKHLVAASLVLAFAGAATADDACNVPMNQWQPREAVQDMAVARGWQVSRIKIDDGCYQIRGVDATSQPFKAKIDPATLAIVELQRKASSDNSDTHERRRPAASERDAPPNALPANRLFEMGRAPTSSVK